MEKGGRHHPLIKNFFLRPSPGYKKEGKRRGRGGYRKGGGRKKTPIFLLLFFRAERRQKGEGKKGRRK